MTVHERLPQHLQFGPDPVGISPRWHVHSACSALITGSDKRKRKGRSAGMDRLDLLPLAVFHILSPMADFVGHEDSAWSTQYHCV